jgi:hypothetical protein
VNRHCVFYKVETELLYIISFFLISFLRGLNILARFQIKKKVCKRMHLNTFQHVPFPILTEVIGPLKEQRVIILTSIIPTLASLKATGPRFSIDGQ